MTERERWSAVNLSVVWTNSDLLYAVIGRRVTGQKKVLCKGTVHYALHGDVSPIDPRSILMDALEQALKRAW